MQKRFSRVLAFGTFDLLHLGHIWFLKQAAKLGKELWVVVARDKNVFKLKGYYPTQKESIRLKQIKNLPIVFKARLGQEDFNHRYKLVKSINPQVIVLGYDQHPSIKVAEQELVKHGLEVKVVRIKKGYKTGVYKSTLLKNSNIEIRNTKISDLVLRISDLIQ